MYITSSVSPPLVLCCTRVQELGAQRSSQNLRAHISLIRTLRISFDFQNELLRLVGWNEYVMVAVTVLVVLILLEGD